MKAIPPDIGESKTSLVLVVRRTFRAGAERLFAAWTDPQALKAWWGPSSVECTDAEVDLRVGGRYRIANRFPDGKVVWISGQFESIERPHKLIYSWSVGSAPGATERVTVTFKALDEQTEVIVVHERIPTRVMRDLHRQGWSGCLDGLVEFVASAGASSV